MSGGERILPQDWEEVDFGALDGVQNAVDVPKAILITTYEWHHEAEEVAAAHFGPDVEIVNVYRSWSEDVRFILGHPRQSLTGVAECRSRATSARVSPDGPGSVPDDPGERIFFGELATVWPSEPAD